jgi:hypothetical protein
MGRTPDPTRELPRGEPPRPTGGRSGPRTGNPARVRWKFLLPLASRRPTPEGGRTPCHRNSVGAALGVPRARPGPGALLRAGGHPGRLPQGRPTRRGRAGRRDRFRPGNGPGRPPAPRRPGLESPYSVTRTASAGGRRAARIDGPAIATNTSTYATTTISTTVSHGATNCVIPADDATLLIVEL